MPESTSVKYSSSPCEPGLPKPRQNGKQPYSERFMIVERDPDQPLVTANIYLTDQAIEPIENQAAFGQPFGPGGYNVLTP